MSQHPNLLRQRKSVGTSLLNVHAGVENVALDEKPSISSYVAPNVTSPLVPSTPDNVEKPRRCARLTSGNKVKVLVAAAVGCVLVATAIAVGTFFSLKSSDILQESDATDAAALNIVEGDAYSALIASVSQFKCMTDCQSGDSIFVTLNAANQVQCAGTSGGGCIWYRGSGCNRLSSPPSSAILNTCTSYSDSRHWCNEGRAQLIYARSLCGRPIVGPLKPTTTTTSTTTKTSTVVPTATPKQGWQCIRSCNDLGNSIFVRFQSGDNRIVCAGPAGETGSRCVWYEGSTCGDRASLGPASGNDGAGVSCNINNSPQTLGSWCEEGWRQLVLYQSQTQCSTPAPPPPPAPLPNTGPYHAVNVPQIPVQNGPKASMSWTFSRSNSWVLDNLISSPDWGYFPDGHIPVLPVDATDPSKGWMQVWSEWRNTLTTSSSPYLENARGNLGFNLGQDKLRQELIGQWNSGGMWIMSVWRVDSNNPSRVIAFFHAEDRWSLSDLKVYKSIGIAWSNDNGRTFTNPVQVMRHWEPKPASPEWSGMGDLDVVWDNVNKRWFCIFTDASGRMSAGVSYDPNAAPGTWKKYYNGDMTEPGLGGRHSPLPGALSQWPNTGANPSISWNTYLGKWLMVYHSWQGAVMITASTDLINWETPRQVVAGSQSGSRAWYPQTISETGDRVTGQRMKLYYGDFFSSGRRNVVVSDFVLNRND